MRRIKEVNGNEEFCEEFFDGLELADDAVVGEVNKGWEVASRQLFHERRAVGGGSEFASGTGARTPRRCRPITSGWPRPPARPTIPPASRTWRAALWCVAW